MISGIPTSTNQPSQNTPKTNSRKKMIMRYGMRLSDKPYDMKKLNGKVMKTREKSLRILFTVRMKLNEFGLKALKVSNRVKHLHIICPRFSCYFLTDTRLKMIVKSLQRLSCLQSLNICFVNRKSITDDGLLHFSKVLKALRSLKKIHLSFHSGRKLTDAGFKSIIRDLRTHPSLEHLSINFEGGERLLTHHF